LVTAKLINTSQLSAYFSSGAMFSSWWSTTPTVDGRTSDDDDKCIMMLSILNY